ncbi:reductive dehalogenase [Dehalogenimonas alkenigignens]|uniref:reductive dehalogenase n=1 Tax=Dehalogenimonas alkenigignens TaxID=1217799 RepID=UPI000D5804E6|nr:reductive dehalogenase [Dehalogenimonas alkenigignens]PVV82619.1 reductive dehalogenase [Dehalogenimonas alkenigignens]
MSKFHSTVSRREFMKGLGLTSAGVGGAAVLSPTFNDLDDMASSNESVSAKRAWWVKQVDEPTAEIDWDIMKRYDARFTTHSDAVLARYVGAEKLASIVAEGAQGRQEAILANDPGYQLRDWALYESAASAYATMSWDGIKKVKTPEQRGVPKWTGTPEENTRIFRAALVFLGATDVGINELDEHHKKLVCTHPQSVSASYLTKWPPPDTVNKRIVFEDVQEGYKTDEKYVIPNKPLWAVTFTIPMSKDAWRTAPGLVSAAGNQSRYRLRSQTITCIQEFLRAIGYQALDEAYPTIPAGAGAVLTGLAECSRNSEVHISPEYGSCHGYFDLITDLPLVPTKPVDAGIFRFCHDCQKCVETCPANSLPSDKEPSWQPTKSSITPLHPPLDPNVPDPEFHNPGKKIFWKDNVTCNLYGKGQIGTGSGCKICQAHCTFNVNAGAIVHQFVKATLSTTSVFNNLFWRADNTFGYGVKAEEDREDWWDLSLPAYGFSTTVAARDGAH